MKSNSNQTPAPKLAPPGAGLPFYQMIAIRLWFGPVTSKRTPLSTCRDRYERITQKLIQLATSIPMERRNQKVLIDPLIGLEDSSRFWSVNEVLEHLLIVSKAMEATISSLASGVIPNHKADTAKVKPQGGNQEWLNEFQVYAPTLLARLDEKLSTPGMNIHSKLRFQHPWFGKINARQWYWMLSTHQALHLQQMKKIISVLKTP